MYALYRRAPLWVRLLVAALVATLLGGTAAACGSSSANTDTVAVTAAEAPTDGLLHYDDQTYFPYVYSPYEEDYLYPHQHYVAVPLMETRPTHAIGSLSLALLLAAFGMECTYPVYYHSQNYYTSMYSHVVVHEHYTVHYMGSGPPLTASSYGSRFKNDWHRTDTTYAPDERRDRAKARIKGPHGETINGTGHVVKKSHGSVATPAASRSPRAHSSSSSSARPVATHKKHVVKRRTKKRH